MKLTVQIEKLTPKPGDLLVITIKDAAHDELAAFVDDGGFADVKAAYPDVKFVVTNGDVRFEIEAQEAIVQVLSVDETPQEAVA